MDRRRHRWGRRKGDWIARGLCALALAALAELGTGLGRWLWGLLWAWLMPLTWM